MSITILQSGFVVGFVASIALGPVTIMCIQRTLGKGRRSGFASGLGAAAADSVSAVLAYFFIAAVHSFVESHLAAFKVAGGVCVVLVGAHFLIKNPAAQIEGYRAVGVGLWHDFASTFVLTLTNPAFVLWLLVIFSAFGVSSPSGEMTSSAVGVGVQVILGFFVGAATWWFILTGVVGLLRGRFAPRHLLWIDRTAGIVIATLGVAAIISAFI